MYFFGWLRRLFFVTLYSIRFFWRSFFGGHIECGSLSSSYRALQSAEMASESYWSNLELYIPGTQRTSVFEAQPAKTMPFPIKTRVIWVPGMHICIYIYIHENSNSLVYIYARIPIDYDALIVGFLLLSWNNALEEKGSWSHHAIFRRIFVVFFFWVFCPICLMLFQGLRESGGQLEFNMIRAWVEEPIHGLDSATSEQAFQQMLVPKHYVLFNPIMNQEETTWKHFKASNMYQNSVVKLEPPFHRAGIHIGSVKNNAGVCHFLMYC